MIGGHSEVGSLRRVFLKHPKDAFPSPDTLDSQWKELGYHRKPDLHRASDEHEALAEILRSLDVSVEHFPAHPKTGLDSIYVRDASVLCDEGAILCNMGKRTRAGEPAAQRGIFRKKGIPVLGEIKGQGRLEGGDLIWLHPDTVAVGRGYRTNQEGIRQLTVLLDKRAKEVVVVPLPHWRGPSDVFHLMSIISPIDVDLALVYSPLMSIPFREFLISRGISLIEVPDSEFPTMGCNVLTVAPRVCVMLEGNLETQRRLEHAGVEVHTYRGDEISVPGEGGPTCLTRPVFRQL